MKRIKTFNELFEASKMNEDCEEFFRITKGTDELKQIETWYKLHPTRTGKINILQKQQGDRINQPGNPYFFGYYNGDWAFEFKASGQTYGTKNSDDLMDLLRTFICDMIFKFVPADFNRKEAREMTDDQSFIFSKIWKKPDEPYVEYRSNKREDIITNLSFVKNKSNLLGTLSKITRVNARGDSNLGSLYIDLSNIVDLIPDGLKDALDLGRYDIDVDGAEIDIIPKGIGTKTISNSKSLRGPFNKSRKVKVTIGYKTEDEVVKAVDAIINKYTKSIIVYRKDKNLGSSGVVESEFLTSIVRSLLGNDLSDNKDSMSIIDDYFKKNPLELYILNNNPKMKAEVIKRTGIKDYGKLGMALKNGLL
jgi:hypothetical protein